MSETGATGKYLHALEVEIQGKKALLPFLPGARIANSPESAATWRDFLQSLEPACRLVRDPETMMRAVPFRDGTWKGDLLLAHGVSRVEIPADVVRLSGRLKASPELVSLSVGAELAVQGDMEIPVAALKNPPERMSLEGKLSVPDALNGLEAGPEILTAWGLGPGGRLAVGGEEFVLERDEAGWRIRPVKQGPARRFAGGRWSERATPSVGSTIMAEVNRKLVRLLKYVGVSADFLVDSPRKAGSNLRKIIYYLRLLQGEMAGGGHEMGDSVEALKNEEVLEDAVRILSELEAGIHREGADEAKLQVLLDFLSDDLLDILREATAAGSGKVSDRAVLADIDYLNSLLGPEVSADLFFPVSTRCVLFLNAALASRQARSAVLVPLRETVGRVAALAESQGWTRRVALSRYLKEPEAMAASFAANAKAREEREAAQALWAATGEALKRTPREFVRSVYTSPELDTTALGQEDKRLFTSLMSFSGRLDDFPFTPQSLAGMVQVNLSSPMARLVAQARNDLSGTDREMDAAGQVFLDNLGRDAPSEFVRFLLRRLDWDLSVIRTFNSLSRPCREAEVDGDSQGRADDLDPALGRELLAKLSRVCLLLGLGKSYLENLEGAWRENIARLRLFTELCLSGVNQEQGAISAAARRMALELDSWLAELSRAAERGGCREARSLLGGFADDQIATARDLLRRFARPVDEGAIARDEAVLAAMAAQGSGLDRLLGGAGPSLIFFNAVAGSRDLKKGVAARVRPIRQALADCDAPGLLLGELTEVLKEPEAALARLRAGSSPETRGACGALARACAELARLKPSRLAKALLAGLPATGDGAVAGDRRLLERLLSAESGGIDQLRLDPSSAVRLLVSRLSPEMAGEVRAMCERGDFTGKPARTMVALARARLARRKKLVAAFNAFARSG